MDEKGDRCVQEMKEGVILPAFKRWHYINNIQSTLYKSILKGQSSRGDIELRNKKSMLLQFMELLR